MANQIIVESGTGNITVTTSRSVIGTVANVASANYANFAGNVVNNAQPNITSVGTLNGLVVGGNITPNANVTYNLGNNTNRFNDLYLSNSTIYLGAQEISANASATIFNGNVAAQNFIGNITGNISNAQFANIANVAYNVSAANVSGLGNIATINLDGNASNVLKGDGSFGTVSVANANYSNFAGTAYSVSGSNVSGAVANATYALDAGNANIANTAYSVSGSNVSGAVANATFANDAANANIANTAYSVSVGNVSGIGNIATINLDGNASNVLRGDGTFSAESGNLNANYANFAGTVLTNAQPNITSLGTLANLDVTGTSNLANINIAGSIVFSNPTTAAEIACIDNGANANSRSLQLNASNVTNVSVSNTLAGAVVVNAGNATQADAGNVWLARSGAVQLNAGTAQTANGNATGGSVQVIGGTGITTTGTATGGGFTFTSGGATSSNGSATVGATSLTGGAANATNGSATTGNTTITTGPSVASNGNSRTGNLIIRTGAANSSTSGTSTVGNIIIDTGTPNGVTANVKGTIAIGNSGNANLITIGNANTPANINGVLNVTGNTNGSNANYTGNISANIITANVGNITTVNSANVNGTYINLIFDGAVTSSFAEQPIFINKYNDTGGGIASDVVSTRYRGAPGNAQPVQLNDGLSQYQTTSFAGNGYGPGFIGNGILENGGIRFTNKQDPSTYPAPTAFSYGYSVPQIFYYNYAGNNPGQIDNAYQINFDKDILEFAGFQITDANGNISFGGITTSPTIRGYNGGGPVDFVHGFDGNLTIPNWFVGNVAANIANISGDTNANVINANRYNANGIAGGAFTTSISNIAGCPDFAFVRYSDNQFDPSTINATRYRGTVSSPAPVANGDYTFQLQTFAISNTSLPPVGTGGFVIRVDTNDNAGNITTVAQFEQGFDPGRFAIAYDETQIVGNVLINGNTNFGFMSGTTFYGANGLAVMANANVTGSLSVGNGNIDLYANGDIDATGRLSYLRTYASFYNPNDIAITANTVANLDLPNTFSANGVSIVSNNQITIARAGTYNIQFSLQLTNSDNAAEHEFDVWFAKNGNDVADSATTFTVIKNNGKNVATLNFIDTAVANDYYQIRYASPSANVSLEAFANISTPYVRPAVPSAIVTVVPVGA